MKLRIHHFAILMFLTSACSGRVQLGDRSSSSSSSSSSGSTGTASFCSNPTIDVLTTQPGGSTMEIALVNDKLFYRGASPFGKTTLVDLPKSGGAPLGLASGGYISAFVVDDHEIFYATLDGGEVTAADTTNRTYVSYPADATEALALDADWLYYVHKNADVQRISRSTPARAPETIARGELPGAIRVDADSVYWVNTYPYGTAAPASLRQAPKAGGAPITLATDDGIDGGEASLRLAMDDTALYWGDRKNHELVKYPKSGGAPVVLAQGADADWVLGLVVDGGNAYWINGVNGPRTLNRVSTSGGAVERIATLEASAYGLVHDGNAFYYTTYFAEPGAVKRVSCN